jgi:hypothetical protein
MATSPESKTLKIRITFKYLPADGKFQKGSGYYVRYLSKGRITAPGNRTIDFRLPKFLWDRI